MSELDWLFEGTRVEKVSRLSLAVIILISVLVVLSEGGSLGYQTTVFGPIIAGFAAEIGGKEYNAKNILEITLGMYAGIAIVVFIGTVLSTHGRFTAEFSSDGYGVNTHSVSIFKETYRWLIYVTVPGIFIGYFLGTQIGIGKLVPSKG